MVTLLLISMEMHSVKAEGANETAQESSNSTNATAVITPEMKKKMELDALREQFKDHIFHHPDYRGKALMYYINTRYLVNMRVHKDVLP